MKVEYNRKLVPQQNIPVYLDLGRQNATDDGVLDILGALN
jgi:hypothetical protein